MKNDNATNSAFPMFTQHGECIHESAAGLSKREYFAGQVMAKMSIAVKAAAGTTEEAAHVILRAAARASVASADALLAELAKVKQ